MIKKASDREKIIIYKTGNNKIELNVKLERDTIWLTQDQIAVLFGTQRPAITKHLKNIFKSGELEEKVVSSILEHTTKHGAIKGKMQTKNVKIYNLDVIISIGYRINSKIATQFRIWATNTLKDYLIQGYTINRKQIAQNYEAFMQTVSSIQNLLPEHVTLDPKMVLELIKEFASTWVTLDAYDKATLSVVGSNKKSIKLSGQELTEVIANFRKELIKKGEATEIFAQERKSGSVEGILGNVMQSLGGKSVYLTAEEKSANLLYFMVKNHPFVDGNKRSGAFAFVWFLRKTKIKGARNINPSALTALTLLIAESQPKQKSQMVALATTLLSAKK